jgi:hypothetical protein
MGANKGHILVSNTYTKGFAYNNNQNKGEPCFYYLDDTMLPTNSQGNEPMILYNDTRSTTLPDATSNEDAILKIQQDQNLLIYDADMSDYVYYNMENTILLFDFGNLNTYDGSDIPPRIYNIKNTLWDYYLTINPSMQEFYHNPITNLINNGSPNNKGFFFRECFDLFVNNTVNQKLIIPNYGHFMCGLRIKVYPEVYWNNHIILVTLPFSIRLEYFNIQATQTHRFRLSYYDDGIYNTACTVDFNSPNAERVTVVFGRLSNGKYFLNVVDKESDMTPTSLPLAASNGTFKLVELGDIGGSGSSGCELNLIQMWNHGVHESNAETFSNNFHNTVSTRWPDE